MIITNPKIPAFQGKKKKVQLVKLILVFTKSRRFESGITLLIKFLKSEIKSIL